MQSDDQNRIYYEPRCHEGNYGLPALLVGARMDEKAFREGQRPGSGVAGHGQLPPRDARRARRYEAFE